MVVFVLALVAPEIDQVQFRTAVLGVGHHAIVRRDGRPVRDLTAADFVVTDSGVPQQITAVDAATVPLDISLVVQEAVYGQAYAVSDFEQEMDSVAKHARPDDRVRVILAGDDQREHGIGGGTELIRSAAIRRTCVPVYDALARALIRRVDLDRQHVVVLISVGEGSGSLLSWSEVSEIAKRSTARIYVVSVEPLMDITIYRQEVSRVVCASVARDFSEDRQTRLKDISRRGRPTDQVRELWLDSKNRLVQLAELTGGIELRPTALRQSNTGPVLKALDDARAGYMLRYTATGVPDSGWHPITVKINRPGKYDIQARPGYQQ